MQKQQFQSLGWNLSAKNLYILQKQIPQKNGKKIWNSFKEKIRKVVFDLPPYMFHGLLGVTKFQRRPISFLKCNKIVIQGVPIKMH